MHPYLTTKSVTSVPIHVLTESTLKSWLTKQPGYIKKWIKTHAFKAENNKTLIVPNAEGSIAAVLHGMSDAPTPWSLRKPPHGIT